MIKQDEIVVFQAYEEVMGVYKALKDFSLEEAIHVFKKHQTKYNTHNLFGFVDWLIEEGYVSIVDNRVFIIDDFVVEEM